MITFKDEEKHRNKTAGKASQIRRKRVKFPVPIDSRHSAGDLCLTVGWVNGDDFAP